MKITRLNPAITATIRKSDLAAIEDTIDLRLFRKAKAVFDANPVVYSMGEVEELLGIQITSPIVEG